MIVGASCHRRFPPHLRPLHHQCQLEKAFKMIIGALIKEKLLNKGFADVDAAKKKHKKINVGLICVTPHVKSRRI